MILLLWVFLFPSILSFPVLLLVVVDLLLTRPSNRLITRSFIMDYLKSEAPFWKKEQTPEGARWVDARVSDEEALARWQP